MENNEHTPGYGDSRQSLSRMAAGMQDFLLSGEEVKFKSTREGRSMGEFTVELRSSGRVITIVVDASVVDGRLFSRCTVRLPTDHAFSCPRIVAMCTS